MYVIHDRFGDKRFTYYDAERSRLELRDPTYPPARMDVAPNWETMRGFARELSNGFDFLRVDLYDVGDRVVFGEFTLYPSGGRHPFQPSSWDYRLGAFWPNRRATATVARRS